MLGHAYGTHVYHQGTNDAAIFDNINYKYLSVIYKNYKNISTVYYKGFETDNVNEYEIAEWKTEKRNPAKEC